MSTDNLFFTVIKIQDILQFLKRHSTVDKFQRQEGHILDGTTVLSIVKGSEINNGSLLYISLNFIPNIIILSYINFFHIIKVLMSYKGWFRYDPSRGIDYRLMVQWSTKNNENTTVSPGRREKPNGFEINLFRELSMIPHYVIKPMKR